MTGCNLPITLKTIIVQPPIRKGMPTNAMKFFDSSNEQPSPSTQPIAIVGMACRFPGAEDLAAFWRLLEAG